MPHKDLVKANFLIYEEDKEDFLAELQEKEVFHISNSRSSTLAEENPDLVPEQKFTDEEAEKIFNKIQNIVDLLKPYSEGKGVLGQFIDLKTGVSPEKYFEIVKNFDVEEVNRICSWKGKLYHLKNKLTELNDKVEFYEEWVDLKSKISEFSELKNVSVHVYRLSADKEELDEKFKGIPVDFRIVFEKEKVLGVIFLVYNGFEDELKEILADFDAETVDFKQEEEKPAEIVASCKKEIKRIKKKISEISEKIEEKSSDFQKYIVLYDYFLSRISRTEVLNKSLTTRDVFFIEGWVEKEKQTILQNLADSYEGVDLNWVKPEKEEKIPVKLKNNTLSSPYEAITRLYAVPQSDEVDPTPYIAMFFAVFFGFCMTDAAYGIALVAISFYLMPKLPEGRKYLWIFVGGGLMTILAGALTGGWFGNNIEMAFPELAAIQGFREKIMVFDPFANPLNFLILSLIFGAIQIFVGLILAIKEKIKKNQYLNAFANEISWIILFIFAGLYFAAGQQAFKYLIPLPALTILFFSSQSSSWFMRLAKGGFNLFNELINFLGNILSYSRIMALGLVTAGLAMSVNILAKIIRELVPGFGVVLAIGLFIGGHLFSIAINTLSSFVHTMRLQFAEFFPYFYEGGGEVFEPFGLVEKYTRVEKKEVLSD